VNNLAENTFTLTSSHGSPHDMASIIKKSKKSQRAKRAREQKEPDCKQDVAQHSRHLHWPFLNKWHIDELAAVFAPTNKKATVNRAAAIRTWHYNSALHSCQHCFTYT